MNEIVPLPKAELVRKPLLRRMCPVRTDGTSYWLTLPISFVMVGVVLPLVLAWMGAGNPRRHHAQDETREACTFQAGRITHVSGYDFPEPGSLRLWLDPPFERGGAPWEILLTAEWPVTIVEDDRVSSWWHVELNTFFDGRVCRKSAVMHVSGNQE